MLVPAWVEDIRLGTVKFVDGAVNYADERTGAQQNIRALNVSVVQPQLSDPLNAQGDLIWREKKINFDANVESIPALLRDQTTAVRLGLKAPDAEGQFRWSARGAAGLCGQRQTLGEYEVSA